MGTSQLIALVFDNRQSAGKHLNELNRLQKNQLLTIEGAAVLEIDENGKPTIHWPDTLAEKGPLAGSVVGGAVGTLVGATMLNPIIGGVLGVLVGSVSAAGAGAVTAAGLEDGFLTDLAAQLRPESSALFIQAASDRPHTAMLEMKPPGGKILKTTLSPFDEEFLQKALQGSLNDLR